MNYHDLQVGKLLDVRSAPLRDVSEGDIFYVVHHVVIGNARWYHHGVILADELELISSGLSKMRNKILAELDWAKADVTAVFLRNMKFLDSDLVDSATQQNITEELASLRASAQEGCFVVFGMVGENEITLTTIPSADAFTAAEMVAKSVREEFGKPFLPLDVSFALPVANELERCFVKAAADIRFMLGDTAVAVH